MKTPISRVTISDFPGPSGNPPDEKDAPCELLNEDQVDAEMCEKCGAECPERVESEEEE